MRRSRSSTVVAVLVVLTLALSGCLSGGSTAPTATPTGTSEANTEDLRALEAVQVTGALGKQPTIVLPATPFTVTTTVVRRVADGDGAALQDGQGLLFHRSIVNGSDGTTVGTTWGSDPQPGLIVGDNPKLGNLDALLVGAHVGARFLLAAPTGSSGSTSGTLVMVLDVTRAYHVPPSASGTAVAPVAGLPTVTLDATGRPTAITPTGTTAPTSLVVQPLVQGTGKPLAKGQAVTVQYTGWLWDGTRFDSSWTGSPFSFVLGGGGVIDGWDEGLVSQHVGSRVLLVVPPDKGYGSSGSGTIPGGATLVFVIDILVGI